MTRQERFRALFEEHYRPVARFVRMRGHGSADADDLIAGTFEVAWRQMDKVPEGREALPWLLGVARNLSRNARRKSRREASFVDELSMVTVPWAEMPIEERMASAEVMGALARLKPVDRDLVLLVAWDELTPTQAGQVLGLRSVTARSRLHRARQRMTALLNESAALDAGTRPASSGVCHQGRTAVRAEEPIEDDPVIRRVAAARPVVPEDDLSPTGARAVTIAERVLAEAGQTSSRRWSRPRWTLPWVGLAVAVVAAAAAIVLVLAGTLSGPDTSGTQPAAAAVIHATLRALAQPPGLIAVDDETYVSGPGIHGHPYTIDEVQETPSGSGAQNALTTTDDPGALLTSHRPALSGFLYLGGEEEVYSPTTDTIYESSIWGPYLHRGRRPGTFFYRDALGAPTYATRPVSLTVRQVRELLDGAATLGVTSPTSGVTTMPPGQAPDQAQTIHEELASHALHFVARTTVDGRAAFELAGRAFAAGDRQVHVYVDPTTHLPFEEVDGIGTRNEVVIRMALRMLPITRSSERLLSLQVLHPGARVDRNHRDYLRAVGDVTVFPG